MQEFARPTYLARQMSRVETRTPGVTDVRLPDLFGSGAGETPALTLTRRGGGRRDKEVEEQHNDTDFYPGSGHRQMKSYVLHV